MDLSHVPIQVYNQMFNDATPERITQIFEWLDEDKTGIIDYLEWSRRLQLDVVPELVKHCREQGPLFQSSLSPEELRQLRRMMRRLHDLADAAKKACPGIDRSRSPPTSGLMNPGGRQYCHLEDMTIFLLPESAFDMLH